MTELRINKLNSPFQSVLCFVSVSFVFVGHGREGDVTAEGCRAVAGTGDGHQRRTVG